MSKLIPLRNKAGEVVASAIVDDDDFELVTRWRWCLHQGRYAARRTWVNGKRKAISLHRFIMNLPSDMEVDHKNQNKLDCRKENLRLATHSQNRQNQNKHKANSTSKFKGVYWCKRRKKWGSEIAVNHKRYHLGRFTSEEDAARAYDEAARIHHGEFAVTNF